MTAPTWARATDDPLADSAQLQPAAGVDAPSAGAVLARHLADPGVSDAKTAKRPHDDLGKKLEAGGCFARRILRRARPGDRERVLVERSGASAGEPHDGLETGCARGGDGGRELRGGAVLLREGELAGGAVEAERRVELARRDPGQDRVGDRGAVRGAVGKALLDEH